MGSTTHGQIERYLLTGESDPLYSFRYFSDC